MTKRINNNMENTNNLKKIVQAVKNRDSREVRSLIQNELGTRIRTAIQNRKDIVAQDYFNKDE